MNAKRRHINADEPLWLVVQQAERSKCFEFSPSNRRAIIIGSAENADLHVSDAAPVAGFLERDESSLWLIPADPNTEIRLDTIKVNEKCRIYSQGLLEVAGMELRLKVRDTPPTLRGDGLVRIDSEICQPRFSRGKSLVEELATTIAIDNSMLQAALGQETAKTRSFDRSVTAGLGLSTRTVETGPIDFDSWFDAAIQPATELTERTDESGWDAAPITPIVVCEANVRDPSTSQAAERPSFKTQELAPLRPIPECQTSPVSPDVAAHGPCGGADVLPDGPSRANEAPLVPVRSEAKIQSRPAPASRIDPYQTIEITRARFAEPSTLAARRSEGTELPLSGTGASVTGATTEFEVPIERTSARGSVDGGDRSVGADALSSGSERDDKSDGASKSRPVSAMTAAHRPLPLTPAEFERAAHVAEKHQRERSSPTETLAKLGILAKQRPVLVLGGASVGSLVLVMFLLGAAHLMGVRTNQNTNQAKSAKGSPSASVAHLAPDLDGNKQSRANESDPSQVSAVASARTDTSLSNPIPDAIAAPPDVAVAVGHLFAGRLPEAEQAYRDLSARYPSDQAFRAATRILAWRNSPACRPGVTPTISCPTVKP